MSCEELRNEWQAANQQLEQSVVSRAGADAAAEEARLAAEAADAAAIAANEQVSQDAATASQAYANYLACLTGTVAASRLR